MIRIHEQRTLPMRRDEAFAFIADFTNVADWDPGITESSKLSDGPVGVGTKFRAISNFGGRRLPLTYVVEEWDEPERAVLYTETSRFTGRDTITFTAVGDATEVDYVAEFTFKGLMRLAEPFLNRTFTKIGTKAMDGMMSAAAARIG